MNCSNDIDFQISVFKYFISRKHEQELYETMHLAVHHLLK
jgi:hypothetical protein